MFFSRKRWIGIISIPNSIYVNFRYLPFRIACKLPFYVRYNASVVINGDIVFDVPISSGVIHLGLNEHPCCNLNDSTSFFIEKGGRITIKGRLFLGNGCKLFVHSGASLDTGDYVRSTGSTSIECFKKICIGDNVLFSWDCLVMDSDSHSIISETGKRVNDDMPIIIESDVWVGCRSVILKGCIVPNNTVIASCTLVTRNSYKDCSIIAGIPARSIKDIGCWKA